MAKTLGLMIQSEWVEMSCPEDSFYLRLRKTRQEWKAQVAQILAEHQIEEVRITANNPELAILKGQAQPPVLIFTAGFENWLTLQNHSHGYGLREVIELSTDSDIIFSLNERVNSQGEVLREVQIKDLESLKTKLLLQNQKSICVCFLHSNVNSHNEELVARYFKEFGFDVHLSSNWPELNDEIIRWSHNLVNFMATRILNDELISLKRELEKQQLNPAISVWTANGLQQEATVREGMGFERALENYIERHEEYENVLHLGTEQFIWSTLDSQGHGLALPLDIHPYSPLIRSIWGLPLVQKQSPLTTPMSLTVSVRPTLFDLLILENSSVLNLEAETLEKQRKRILNSLYSMTRSDKIGPRELPMLPKMLIQLCATQIFHFVLKNKNSDAIQLTGVFAPVLIPYLRQIAPTIKWTLSSESDFSESQIILEELSDI